MDLRSNLRSKLPLGASYPVHPIPLLPLDTPATRSASFSNSKTEAPRTAHSRATASPTTPPPIIAISEYGLVCLDLLYDIYSVSKPEERSTPGIRRLNFCDILYLYIFGI